MILSKALIGLGRHEPSCWPYFQMSIKWPCEGSGGVQFRLDPITMLFLFLFGVTLVAQFFSMLVHRYNSLLHIVANHKQSAQLKATRRQVERLRKDIQHSGGLTKVYTHSQSQDHTRIHTQSQSEDFTNMYTHCHSVDHTKLHNTSHIENHPKIHTITNSEGLTTMHTHSQSDDLSKIHTAKHRDDLTNLHTTYPNEDLIKPHTTDHNEDLTKPHTTDHNEGPTKLHTANHTDSNRRRNYINQYGLYIDS